MKYLIYIMLALAFKSAFAIDCEKVFATPDVNECARIAQEKVEKQLNETYQRVLKQADEISKNPETELQKNFKKEFIEAQRLWVKFREADCQNVYTFWSGGTIRGSMYIVCMQNRAEQRIKELAEYEETH